MDTDKKKPLSWIASGSSDAARAVSDWVAQPESKKDMVSRAAGVALGGVVGIAMIHDMGLQGVLIDAGAVIGTAAWMHFSPKSKKRQAAPTKAPEGLPKEPVGSQAVVMDEETREEVVSNDGTEGRPDFVQPMTCDDVGGFLDDEPTVRLNSGEMSRQDVHELHETSEEAPNDGVHAGHELAPASFAKRPTVGQGTNQVNPGESVSKPGTAEPEKGSFPSSEGVQELDNEGDDWFISFLRRNEEIEVAEAEQISHIPAPHDPFDAASMVQDQPPLWREEKELPVPVEKAVPDRKGYREMQGAQDESRKELQDRILMEALLNHLSVREIADKYEVPSSTVQSWLSKAKERHRQDLKSFHDGGETSGNSHGFES